MPLQRSTEDIPSALDNASNGPSCEICKKCVSDKASRMETVCRHIFHKICINNHIKTSSTCPSCGIKITKDSSAATSAPSHRVASPMVTRSSSKAKNYDASRSMEVTEAEGNLVSDPPMIAAGTLGEIKQLISSAVAEQQAQMLTTLTSHLSNLVENCLAARSPRIISASNPHTDNVYSPSTSRPPVMQTLPDVEQRTLEQLLGLPSTLNNQGNVNADQAHAVTSGNILNRSHSTGAHTVPDLIFRPDKVSQIMFNWRLKFTGGSDCLPVDSFIYRVNALTNQTLNGNFEILCGNASTLFEDKANKWFWRFHRNFPNFRWSELCRELRLQYGDSRTDVDFREMIRDRKQKANENFDDFYNSVIDIVDRLDQPLPDRTLVEILRRNLQPEIQHEILNLTITSVSQLREICRRREFFLQDMRRKHGTSAVKSNPFSKRVSEVEVEQDSESELLQYEGDEVSEVNIICWNCRKPGHRHDDCLAERTIFCYGCGKPQTYKPHCPKCSSHSKNLQKTAPKGAPKTHSAQPIPEN